MLTEQAPRAKAGRLAEGVGLALVIVGLTQAAGLFDILTGAGALTPSLFRPLMLAMALMVSCLAVFGVREGNSRHAGADDLIAGLCFLVGVVALWSFSTNVDTAQARMFSGAYPWIAVFGLAAIIMFTWRLWGAPLALAAIAALVLAAVWHAATWRPGLDWLQSAPIDAALNIAGALWFNLDDGALGWVLDVLLSSVLPLFILGSMLANRTFLGSAMGSRHVGEPPISSLFAAFHAVSRRLAPTLVIGSLFMMARPGIDLTTIALVWLLPVGACLIWFWAMPVAERGAAAPGVAGWRDLLLIGAALATMTSTLLSGVSLQLSAIIALGVVITLSIFDADVQRSPNVILLALARSGIAFGRLLIAAGAVGLILAVLDRTGLPIDVARLLAGVAGESQLPLLVLSAMVAIAMGLVMPGFAAYLIVVALIGPALRTVGIADPAAHTLILTVSAMTVAIGRGVESKTA